MSQLRAAGRAALAGARLPSARDEPFRFTDMSALAQARPSRPPSRAAIRSPALSRALASTPRPLLSRA